MFFPRSSHPFLSSVRLCWSSTVLFQCAPNSTCTRLRYSSLSAGEYVAPQVSPNDKIFIALSSGVDSSVVAALLLRSGHPRENLHPFYMANWSPAENPPPSTPPLLPYNKPRTSARPHVTPQSKSRETEKCTEREFSRIKELCSYLGLQEPLYLSFEKEYWTDVFVPMVESYQRGWTPNPDVGCNREVKFGAAMSRLEKIFNSSATAGKWWIATGHYAHILHHVPTSTPHLLRSQDPNKDQTFYLSTLHPSSLHNLLFPLASHNLSKPLVKAMARNLGLPGWRPGEPEREESMGLCFVEPGGGKSNGAFRRLLDEYLDPEPGDFVVGPSRTYPPSEITENVVSEGTVVGTHQGLWHATVGEKSHFEFPQGDTRFKGRWYVSRKNRNKNQIEVVKGWNNARLFSRGMVVSGWRWLAEDAEKIAVEGAGKTSEGGGVWGKGLVAQFRHRQTPLRVIRLDVESKGDNWMDERRLRVTFEEPERAVTPGQSAALWWDKRCLGGGVIEDILDVD
ncbi:hypothetical protein RUND412_002663 [Rhizina undulata]